MATPTRPSHTHARAYELVTDAYPHSTMCPLRSCRRVRPQPSTAVVGTPALLTVMRPPSDERGRCEKARVTSPSLPCQAARRALGEAYIGAWLKPGGDAAQITPAEVAAAARASLGQSDRDSLTTEVAEEWMAHLLPKNVKNASFFYFGVKREA